ncbi:alanine racemase C-terminal domain-containing protein, partial [Nocardia farcinica]|uniref:alanine racemase C-terminal domain-containing protein n=1 Tax=Nocardia farcinica TaxID=37329 RepID=UPI002456576A
AAEDRGAHIHGLATDQHEFVRALDATTAHQCTPPRHPPAALNPAGYAAGVSRPPRARFDVWLGGARRPNVGRVCMDQFVVDLGDDAAGVAAGDTAVLFGGGPGVPGAQEWADLLGTIHYEVVCSPRGRAVRRYVGTGR